jgi:hypothetical protein
MKNDYKVIKLKDREYNVNIIGVCTFGFPNYNFNKYSSFDI